jgi:hypothetical protein
MSVRTIERGCPMSLRKLQYLLLLTLFASGVSRADAPKPNYSCRILDVKQLSRDGLISENGTFKFTIGMAFGVDRHTGEISGKPVSNSNTGGVPKILDYGSVRQAFKVMTIYEPFVSVSYLQIDEFEDGDAKPFIFYDQFSIYSGLCHHSI